MKINPSMKGQIPSVSAPQPWTSKDGGKTGWKLTVPGDRPLATPAVVNGKVFLGGGFGSYDFYAFDAITGNVLWQYQTEDDGPTSAVVHHSLVAFNTESCELEVLTTEGERVWKKWLGDPLMSMPAMDDDTVYQVFPDSRDDRHHYLGAFRAQNGDMVWKKQLPGEIITAPVLANGHVYVSNLNGSMSCFRKQDGEKIWQEDKKATSSPVVWKGQCYFSKAREVTSPKGTGMTEAMMQKMELLASSSSLEQGETQDFAGTLSPADYLDIKKRSKSPHYAAAEHRDGTVGFAFHKGDAKMDQAQRHLGHGHVSSLWAYQGSKPFIYREKLYSAVGDRLYCADPGSRENLWTVQIYENPKKEEILDNVMTPPVLVNGKLFAGTIRGEIICLNAETGEFHWRIDTGEPIIFQPAVMGGRVYASTNQGNLFCFETGDPLDDGWQMWGGNAAHNGLVEEQVFQS